MLVLGLNTYHGDAAACLVRAGRVVAAAEEERFRRVKHWVGFPSLAVCYCLSEGGVTLGDLDLIAVNSNPRANLRRKLRFAVRQRPNLALILDRINNRLRRTSVSEELERTLPGQTCRASIHSIEHHIAHLASAFYASPFTDAMLVSVDGFGDFASAAWGYGDARGIHVESRVLFPHSLGIFYQAMTQFLGFPNYGDEYKVMGLASFGKPRYLREMEEILRLSRDGGFALNLAYFRHHREKISYQWSGGAPGVGALYSSALAGLLGPPRSPDEALTQRHRDLASSVQAWYEEAFFNLLSDAARRFPRVNLGLSGGCAMNSVANGKIKRRMGFKAVYIPAAAGDAGGALGAALQVAWTSGCRGREGQMDHAYWGPSFSDGEIGDLLDTRRMQLQGRRLHVELVAVEEDLCRETARAIAAGLVVGWFQGRMEWGPRALGNRSIVCDPRRGDIKDLLNAKIKRRESFRPFAPSVLREAVGEWFEEDVDVPFMSEVFSIREDKRALIPAVTHVDGSGRVQTVHRQTNPLYYRLIECFRDITGIPMVLNTSFNENEPIVCLPQEALDCFLRTDMDCLVLGHWRVSRRGLQGPACGVGDGA